jgi:hypothetical protein
MANQISYQCPNCGASSTNSLNCEYCGSILVRFEAQNIPLNMSKYGKEGFSLPGLEEALQRNIDLQKKYPGEMTCTDIDENSGVVNLQVCKAGMIEDEDFDPFRDEDPFDKPGLEVALRFVAGRAEDIKYWKIFEKMDIFKLFKVKEHSEDRPVWKECYIYYGEDYVSASRMITTIIKDVYGMDESTLFTINTWSDGEQVSPSNNNAPVSKGCYIATAIYGSYDCPEVWTLRRYRDFILDQTWGGRLFIKIYYSISPTLVKWFGESNWFHYLMKTPLDKMVKKLQRKGVDNTPYEDKY